MKLLLILLLTAVVIQGAYSLAGLRRRRRRDRLLRTPFPADWVDILQRNLPPYGKLPERLRQQLHDRIRIFLAEKRFEGCGGLVLTDEIRVTIAAQACMLLLNRPVEIYPKLVSVLVYPSTYVANGNTLFDPLREEESVRLGESWHTGAVVLAWDSVKHGAANFQDGQNVALHEFAHQLDQESGSANGAPKLSSRSAYAAWTPVFSREYARLRRRAARGQPSLLDDYGASAPAEFFAVATEAFFEKPGQLKNLHPALYHELQRFYQVNPLAWQDGRQSRSGFRRWP